MKTFQPADHLRSRTFLGLLVAQFLAAFNDQAIHASAMFFAINTNVMSERGAISLMPILFYAPWAIFATLAGWLADRYSKQRSLIFWKVAEVVICLVALGGFYLGRQEGMAKPGVYLVLSTVFLMGMHSAFFVPAKYGAMPEILTARMLSRGNGVLESLSFLAVILGTVVGGVLSTQFRGHEHYIGVVLLGLAVVGALASFFIERMPAANLTRPFPPYLYKPLWENIRVLVTSRPLAFAIIGIAFFTFLVAFMRQVVYMHGQVQVPPWSEQDTSLVVGMVGLGIGLGSPLVGYLSAGKVEVGLVPIGTAGMVLTTAAAALLLGHVPALVVCIILIGFFTGFYLVPLFTLLQHRAPKTSKGDSIATSNFINVLGAILASVVFYAAAFAAERTGLSPEMRLVAEETGTLIYEVQYEEGHPHEIVILSDETGNNKAFHRQERKGDYRLLRVRGAFVLEGEVVVRTYEPRPGVQYIVAQPKGAERPVYDESRMPQLLFLAVAALNVVTLGLLWGRMPDLFLRTALWFRFRRKVTLEVAGMGHLPSTGPAIIVTDAREVDALLQVFSATDRTSHFVLPGNAPVGSLVRGSQLVGNSVDELLPRALEVLKRSEVLGLPLDADLDRYLEAVGKEVPAPVLPVLYEAREKDGRTRVFILGGPTLPAGSTADAVRREVERLRHMLVEHERAGGTLTGVMAETH